jgi:hypothetical protein
MVTETVDFIVGVDTHGRRHAFALVDARTGALVGEWQLEACAGGYRQALALAEQAGGGRRLWALELARRQHHPPTIAYIQRRLSEGKSSRDASRCLKRYLARHFYRLLEQTAVTA